MAPASRLRTATTPILSMRIFRPRRGSWRSLHSRRRWGSASCRSSSALRSRNNRGHHKADGSERAPYWSRQARQPSELHLSGACFGRAPDTLDKQDQATEQHHCASDKRVEVGKIGQTPCHGNDPQNRYRQSALGNEHADQFGNDFLEHGHCTTSTLTLRAREAPTSPAARNRATNSSSAKSWPGQAIPSPSPVQKTPNADSITPTPNLRVFSGTRDSGRWSIAPAARTSAQAASAPRLAGNSNPRPAPTAITMNTTSRPSSSTALSAVIPATQSRLLCWCRVR